MDGRKERGGAGTAGIPVILVVLAVIVGWAAITYVRDSQRQEKEACLRQDLEVLRNAVDKFHCDVGLFPEKLTDLTATAPPREGISAVGTLVTIDPREWHGQYLEEVPKDPISGDDYALITGLSDVGRVQSSALGKASDGRYYSQW